MNIFSKLVQARNSARPGLLALLAIAPPAVLQAQPQPTPIAGGAPEPSFTLEQVRALAGRDGFQPYAGNPVLQPGGPGAWDAGALGSLTVLKVQDVYHLYYEAWGVRSKAAGSQAEYNTLQIGHATSRDGIHWTKDPHNPVVPRGATPDAWDAHGTWDPFVLHEDGLFKMWYGGGNETCDWGYATSPDGTHFTKRGCISRLGKVEDDHVVHDAVSRRYYMYYWDRAREPLGLFRAASTNETDFDFANARPLKIAGEQYPGRYKFTHVFIEGGAWYMLYGNFVRPHCPNSTVRLAVSPDGVAWRSVNRNLAAGHDGELLRAADGLYLLYYGPRNHFDAAGCDIRVALYQGTWQHLADPGRPAAGDGR